MSRPFSASRPSAFPFGSSAPQPPLSRPNRPILLRTLACAEALACSDAGDMTLQAPGAGWAASVPFIRLRDVDSRRANAFRRQDSCLRSRGCTVSSRCMLNFEFKMICHRHERSKDSLLRVDKFLLETEQLLACLTDSRAQVGELDAELVDGARSKMCVNVTAGGQRLGVKRRTASNQRPSAGQPGCLQSGCGAPAPGTPPVRRRCVQVRQHTRLRHELRGSGSAQKVSG